MSEQRKGFRIGTWWQIAVAYEAEPLPDIFEVVKEGKIEANDDGSVTIVEGVVARLENGVLSKEESEVKLRKGVAFKKSRRSTQWSRLRGWKPEMKLTQRLRAIENVFIEDPQEAIKAAEVLVADLKRYTAEVKLQRKSGVKS